MSFTQRLEEMLNTRKISKITFLTDLGYSKNAISEWRNGITKSYMNKIDQIADYLGCSVDYLLGRTQFAEMQKAEDIRLEKIASIFQNLPDDESKNRLLRVVEAFELSNRYETESRYIGGIAAKGGNAPIIRKGQKKED